MTTLRLAALLAWLLPTAALAEIPLHRVEIGMQLQALRDVNIAAGRFEVTVLVWTSSLDGEFDPAEQLLATHGHLERTRILSRVRSPDGRYVVVALIEASFDQHLDSSLYPFDRHDLRIAFQPLRPASQVLLSPAPTSTGCATDFFSIGWRVGAARLDTGEHRAGTDFGTGDDAYRHYSRASITLPVARQLGLVGLGHFAGFAVAIVIALGSFSIPPTHFSVRMSLFGSAVFAGIGNRYLLNDRIGIGPASALSEMASTVAFLCAGIALVSAVIDERHRDTGKRWIAVWADRCGLALCSMLGAFALARVLWAATRI